ANREFAIDTGMLKNDPDSPAQSDRIGPQIIPQDSNLSGLKRHQGGKQLEEGGFTAPIGTEQAEDFPAFDREAEVLRCGPLPIGEAERAYFNCQRAVLLSLQCGRCHGSGAEPGYFHSVKTSTRPSLFRARSLAATKVTDQMLSPPKDAGTTRHTSSTKRSY